MYERCWNFAVSLVNFFSCISHLQASSQVDELDTSRLPVTAQSLDSRGLYIYDDGLHFVLWFGRMLPPDVAMNLLGEDFATDLSKVCF